MTQPQKMGFTECQSHMILPPGEMEALVERALAEDVASGDATTEALVPPDLLGKAVVVAKAQGVLAGGGVAVAVFRRLDGDLEAVADCPDGSSVRAGDVVLRVEGHLAPILTAERVTLNFLQRLSGIATLTRRYVQAVEGTRARIVDTRKTTPGLRALEKYAVRVGGGTNHRRSLSDGILIKDNHIRAMAAYGVGLGELVRRARAKAAHGLKVQVEVETLEELVEALDAGAELVLLDNMKLAAIAQAVEMARGRALLEASGGVTLETVRQIAEAGVDLISIGALTHSAPALDMSLELVSQ